MDEQPEGYGENAGFSLKVYSFAVNVVRRGKPATSMGRNMR